MNKYNPNNIIGGPPDNMPSPAGWSGRLARANQRKARHEYDFSLIAIRRPYVILGKLKADVITAEHNRDVARSALDRIKGSLEVNYRMAATGKYDLRATIIKQRSQVERAEENLTGAEENLTAAREKLAAHELTMPPAEPVVEAPAMAAPKRGRPRKMVQA